MIDPKCCRCKKELETKGGVFLMPPSRSVQVGTLDADLVDKLHLCVECAADVVKFLEIPPPLDGVAKTPCTLDNCGHMRQLDAIVDFLGMTRGTRSVLDELRTRVDCVHVGLTVTLSGGEPRQAGRVQWCTGCGSARYEQHIKGEWAWCNWMRAGAPPPGGPASETWEDTPDEWTAAIKAAHPGHGSESHDEYGVAMRMVGHRHSKGELVALVNWLLVRIKTMRATTLLEAEQVIREVLPGHWTAIERFREMALFVQLGRPLTEMDELIIDDAMRAMEQDLLAQSARVHPDNIAWKAQWLREARMTFTLAGISPVYVREIDNKYCGPKCCPHRVWLLVTTRLGVIEIGWRKRVIVIDWSASDVTKTAAELFADEDVTKGVRMIHAWSYEKATEYLTKIAESMDDL